MDTPTPLGLEDLSSTLDVETLNTELMNDVSERMSFFRLVNADALELALEFEEFKAKRAG